eukprot:scaffold524_cov184-Skeletonema_marinoi.AAC.4
MLLADGMAKGNKWMASAGSVARCWFRLVPCSLLGWRKEGWRASCHFRTVLSWTPTISPTPTSHSSAQKIDHGRRTLYTCSLLGAITTAQGDRVFKPRKFSDIVDVTPLPSSCLMPDLQTVDERPFGLSGNSTWLLHTVQSSNPSSGTL